MNEYVNISIALHMLTPPHGTSPRCFDLVQNSLFMSLMKRQGVAEFAERENETALDKS
jgi:hypothetical protein